MSKWVSFWPYTRLLRIQFLFEETIKYFFSVTFKIAYFKCEKVCSKELTIKSAGYGFDSHLRMWNIYLHLYFHFFALVSRQSAVLSSGGKWETEFLTFFLPTMLCAGFSVKLFFLIV